MLSRSIFFEKYLLVDFDTVESKNLRNQWYESNQIHQTKVQASNYRFSYRGQSNHKEIIPRNAKFQEIQFHLYDFKYVMSAFDSIETRLEFLDTVTSEQAKAKYLFDARYDDLTASVFFIDLENKDEVEYYRQGLLEDKKAFDKLEQERKCTTFDKFKQWLEQHDCFSTSCSSTKILLANKCGIPSYQIDSTELIICPRVEQDFPNYNLCGKKDCLARFEEFYNKHKEPCSKLTLAESESSCIRQNFIDIYHYASTYIFDAIRVMESENPKKLFTHVDVTTDPLPTAMILRK